jgi:sulfur-oxidizing protein SoxB
VGGLGYSICPAEPVGRRISELRLGDKLLEPSRNYTVAGWASVAEGAAQAPGAQPVWELVETWMAAQPGGRVSPRAVLQPHIIGMESPSGPQARSAETGR